MPCIHSSMPIGALRYWHAAYSIKPRKNAKRGLGKLPSQAPAALAWRPSGGFIKSPCTSPARAARFCSVPGGVLGAQPRAMASAWRLPGQPCRPAASARVAVEPAVFQQLLRGETKVSEPSRGRNGGPGATLAPATWQVRLLRGEALHITRSRPAHAARPCGRLQGI